MENKLTNFDEIFKKIYYNPSNPGSFGGQYRLFLEARKVDSSIKRKDVENWLKGQIVYTLHKPSRRRFKRNPIIAEYPKENFQADLVDVQNISKENDNFKYILTVVDIFTKMGYAMPVKNKNQTNVAEAMEKILIKNKPVKLQTDKGKEFQNTEFKRLMKKYNINHFFSENREIKCSIVERFNRTIKKRMFAFFTLNGIHRYVDNLQNIVDSYNHSFHRSIKMRPIDVTLNNAKMVFKNLYGYEDKRQYLKKFKQPKLHIGDDVRKKYDLRAFDKGFYANWTDQIFKVQKALSGNKKPYYKVEDTKGSISQKRFYPEELQNVTVTSFRVEKVLKRRIRNGVKEVFVKWLNHPESENSWIPSTNLKAING